MRSLGPEDTMPCWYYDKKEIRGNTPSFRDGIDPDVESRYRKEGARFITNTGNKMGLRHYETLATGIVYFHRFYMIHSFKQFPRYVTACCCLFLAGKVEETPKKCKDIIKAARSLLNDQQFAQFGEDPKEEVMTLERILLQTMKFDLQVDHPYKYLLRYAKCLKGDQAKLQNMVQMAWTFINDSLFTTLCLQWEPEIIGIALMYLASKLTKFEIQDWNGRLAKHVCWWDMYVEDISIELLEDVCHQVLDLYSNSSKDESPPPTTPPPSVRQAAVAPPLPGHTRPAPPPNNEPHPPPAQAQQKKTKMTPPSSTQPKAAVDPSKMEQMIMDPALQMQAHVMPNQGEAHLSMLHNYKYPAPLPGLVEGYVPQQYIPSPNQPPYSFGEMGMPTPSVMDASYASAGYYDASGFPASYMNPVPGAPPPPYPGAVPLHYLHEPPGFPTNRPPPPPAQPSQFSAAVYPPTAYAPPAFATSPVPNRPPGMGRAGTNTRLPNRQNAHPNWGV